MFIEFSEEELYNICLALINTKRGNNNKKAVKEFEYIQNKIQQNLSSERNNLLSIIESLEPYSGADE